MRRRREHTKDVVREKLATYDWDVDAVLKNRKRTLELYFSGERPLMLKPYSSFEAQLQGLIHPVIHLGKSAYDFYKGLQGLLFTLIAAVKCKEMTADMGAKALDAFTAAAVSFLNALVAGFAILARNAATLVNGGYQKSAIVEAAGNAGFFGSKVKNVAVKVATFVQHAAERGNAAVNDVGSDSVIHRETMFVYS